MDATDRAAPAGRGRGAIDFAAAHMPALAAMAREVAGAGRLRGRRVGVALMLEPKTACLVEALAAAGAEVEVLGNDFSTKPEVVDALRDRGITVHTDFVALTDPADPAGPAGPADPVGPADAADAAGPGRPAGRDVDPRAAIDRFVDQGLEFIADDGAVVSRYIHQHRRDALTHLKGVAEETTSGVQPLRLMAAAGQLEIPVIAVNDARTKVLFDNVYGTGHSVVMAVLDVTNVQMPGSRVVVVGYGYVGSGIAQAARALGGIVQVTEIDPLRALLAHHDGFAVSRLSDVLPDADLVITATGAQHTLTGDELALLPHGAIVAVGGAGRWEVDVNLGAPVVVGDPVRPHVRQLTTAVGSEIFLVADGHCANTTAGEGNPIEIMDLSLALQLRALDRLAVGDLAPGVHLLDREIEGAVATAQLDAEGIALDSPGPAQRDAAQRW